MNAPDGRWNLQAQSRARRLARATAALGDGLRGKRVVAVLSGGNVDRTVLADVMAG